MGLREQRREQQQHPRGRAREATAPKLRRVQQAREAQALGRPERQLQQAREAQAAGRPGLQRALETLAPGRPGLQRAQGAAVQVQQKQRHHA